MNILINHRKEFQSKPYHEWFKGHNLAIIYDESDSELDKDIIDKFYNHAIGLKHYKDDIAYYHAAKSLLKEFPVDRIVALAECDIIRSAKLRDQFSISGQNLESAMAFRDKLIMNQRGGSHLNKNFGVMTENIETIKEKIALFPDGIIVKPRKETGCKGVYRILDQTQLNQLPIKTFSNDYIYEEFVSGVFYHIDGLMQSGEILLASTSRCTQGVLEVVNDRNPVFVEPEDSGKTSDLISEYLDNLLNILPCPEVMTAFHAELILQDNRITLVEIASRTGGAYIRELVKSKYDIDLERENALGQAGLNDINQLGLQEIPKPISALYLISDYIGKELKHLKMDLISNNKVIVKEVKPKRITEDKRKPTNFFRTILYKAVG